MQPHNLSLPLIAALVGAPLAAQGANQYTAGLGTVKRFFNASILQAPFDYVINGVAVVGDECFVGTRNATQRILVTKNGVLQRTFPTPGAPAGGTYDMDTDGKIIFAISGAGIIAFDVTGANTNLSVETANGAKSLTTNPIPLPFILQGFNAGPPVIGGGGLAFDPTGDNGDGSFFVVSHTGAAEPITEIKLDGTVIKSYPNRGWRGGALTRDPRTGNLWCVRDAASLSPGGGMDVIELDKSMDFQPTGNRFMQGNPSGQWDIRCCGGICGIPGGDSHSYNSDFDIAVVNAIPGDDYVFIHRVHLVKGTLGYDEGFLKGSINSTTLTKGANFGDLGEVKDGDTFRFQTDAGTSVSLGNPAITLLNVGADARRTGSAPIIAAELRALGPYTNPSSFVVLELFGTLGGPMVTAQIPPNILNCFDRVRLQSVYLDVNAPGPFKLIATNEIFATAAKEAGCAVVVEAVGANSFNADTTSGFFRVIQKGGLPIEKVVFDMWASGEPNMYNMYFDTDNPTMADQFNYGNSTAVGFTGTYRNNSDVNCGLIYDALNTPVGAGASIGANTGWIGTNEFNNGNRYTLKTITFRFQPNMFLGTTANPKVFEFDVDTDGGPGVTGSHMAGMVIRVTLLGGATYTGVLQADPTSATPRSVTGF